jgi:putative transposon-encoded protein
MDLGRKFQDATSCHSVKMSSLKVDRKYPITFTEKTVTKFGSTVLISIRDTSFHTVKVFIPKRYGSAFSDAEIEDINTEKLSLHLIYKGTCDKTKSHISALEKKSS